jgi:hypothetical protein
MYTAEWAWREVGPPIDLQWESALQIKSARRVAEFGGAAYHRLSAGLVRFDASSGEMVGL